MNRLLEQIVETVLYEGFMLYPYRPSATKNRQRFTCGRVYPQAYSLSENGLERCAMQTECLILDADHGELRVSVRFLHPIVREVGVLAQPMADSKWDGAYEPPFQSVPEVRIDGRLYQSWQEATERRVQLPVLSLGQPTRTSTMQFSFGTCRWLEPIKKANGEVAAIFIRRQEPIEGTVEVMVRPLERGVSKLTVRVLNTSPFTASSAQPEAVLLRTMASTHTVLELHGVQFSSLLEPLPEHKRAAEECVNLGTWPVLVGDPQLGQRDTMLSSPIILYDYPQVAPESPGASFDGTEIDELLALCIQTLTDDEKKEMRSASEETRRLLERTESLSSADWLRLHGTYREPPNGAEPGTSSRLTEVKVQGVSVKVGDRVRLKPQGRADIFDLALNGQLAEVESIEQDFEDRVHIAVVLESDPGRDLGLLRQPGHRFFFGIDELEPVAKTYSAATCGKDEAHD